MKLKLNFFKSTKNFWSGLFATVFGILLTIGAAEYQDYRKKEEMKHDLIVAAIGDFYDYQDYFNAFDISTRTIAESYRVMQSHYNPATHQLDATDEEIDDFIFGINPLRPNQLTTKAEFFKNTSILDLMGDAVLLNVINSCYDECINHHNYSNEIQEIAERLLEPYMYNYNIGLPIDKDMVVRTLESSDYRKLQGKIGNLQDITAIIKEDIESKVQRICAITGISLQEVIALREAEKEEQKASAPCFAIPKYGIVMPMSSEVTEVTLRNDERYKLLDWKCASAADKDTVDVTGAKFCNLGYDLTIDSLFSAEALPEIGRQIAEHYRNNFTEECQYKTDASLAESEITTYVKPIEGSEELEYMAVAFGRASSSKSFSDHAQVYNVYVVLYLPYIDQYIQLHMDGNIFSKDEMLGYIKEIQVKTDDHTSFTGTLLPEQQRMANSKNQQWMDDMINAVKK